MFASAASDLECRLPLASCARSRPEFCGKRISAKLLRNWELSSLYSPASASNNGPAGTVHLTGYLVIQQVLQSGRRLGPERIQEGRAVGTRQAIAQLLGVDVAVK